MIAKKLEGVFKSVEEQRIARILLVVLATLLLTYLIVMGTALYRDDWELIIYTAVGCVLLLAPLGLLLRGHLRASGLIMILSVLISATLIATVGQGVHDTAIMAYPVIVVFASLILPRRDFAAVAIITMIAMCGLALSEAGGLFVAHEAEPATLVDLTVMVIILAVAILMTDMLATNMRRNLFQAQLEIEQRKTLEEQLRHQSSHDALTGIFNRSYFEEALARLEHSQEFPISIVVADVNDLKVVNDTRGHALGDELLRQTATVLGEAFRFNDRLARIGGDEFAVLLPHTDAVTAAHLLDRIRQRLAEHNLRRPDLPIGIALGAATAEKGGLADALISADQRMYAEKARQKSHQAS